MDSALKQRLLGAAVLVALAIIFVPMFLGNTPPKSDSAVQSLEIPPLPERKFETRTLPVEPAAPAGNAQAPAAVPGRSPDAIVTVDTRAAANGAAPVETTTKGPAAEPAKAPAAATPVPDAKTVPAPETKPAAAAAAVGRFSVNLGIYADERHAETLVERLKKLGYSAYSEPTEYQGKAAQRVRVGPFADRAAAEAARLKIKQAEPKAPGSISEAAEPSPQADAPAAAVPANRPGAWAVQLGAFKSEAEANKLRDRVRTASVAAFVDRSGSGEQVLWRVRAGPYVDRAGAESARATLKQKQLPDGMIVTQP